MTYKATCPVENNQVILTLPPDFRNKKQMKVYFDDQVYIKSQKVDAMRIAAIDPFFLADIQEILADFDSVKFARVTSYGSHHSMELNNH